ncbi:post-GPI attachment to proteins factor 2-like isoform X2 [Acropora millepora]|uniref:post-GPI attachment to proteins factor 2-like isoform X2 n=1 Tax=Acropora millepora TaxID=45264 RepID=UPI001CF1A24F|nr:post-GPI attachment to proteins factor 2-like isoform X2 [Acropora millepora]
MGSTIRPQSPIFSISFNLFAMWICSLPLASLLACVAISILWHFDETTRTHCKVANYLPSISASIGGHMPETFIWRVGIALHCLPRVLIVPYSLHKYFSAAADRKYKLKTWWFSLLNLTASVLHLLENGALIVLTYISSIDNRGEGKPEFLEKTYRCRVENQQNQPTFDAGSGNRTRATLVGGECSHHCAIPEAPSLLLTSSIKMLFTPEQHRKISS